MSAGPRRVITLHGLWMTGVESGMLRRRLREEFGFLPEQFYYKTVGRDLSENAARLKAHIESLGADGVDLVGHSLGGIVALQMLTLWPKAPVGRVVCIGSPINGSSSAEGLSRLPGLSQLLGKSIRELLQDPEIRWSEALERFEVGCIGGTLGMGLGRIFTTLPQPNDGTVALVETEHPSLTDHIAVAASHTGLVVSREVCAQVACFLEHGKFRR